MAATIRRKGSLLNAVARSLLERARGTFRDVFEFKTVLVAEEAFTAHLLRSALARELKPADSLVVDGIVKKSAKDQYRLQGILRQVALSSYFLGRP